MLNKRIKVLWLSNRLFESADDNRSGTWLLALGPELIKSERIELANISFGKVTKLRSCDHGGIRQWAIPYPTAVGKLPPQKIINQIQEAIESFQPDIIQIWGVEQYWGLLKAEGFFGNKKVLLNIQGIMRSIAAVYDGNMTFSEKWSHLGLRELRYPSSNLFAQKRLFEKLSAVEEKIVGSVKYVTVQSDWSAGQIHAINPDATVFRTNRALRPEFYTAPSWKQKHPNSKEDIIQLFTTCFGNPYKGFHIILKALSILKKEYPKVQLRVSAQFGVLKWKRSSYEKYVAALIEKYEFQKHITWLGPLNASRLIQEFQEANCYIHPSFIESFSLSTAEALATGTPTVCAFSGALPEMNGQLDHLFYFSPGDYVQLANCITKVIESPELMQDYSTRSNAFILERCNREVLIKEQLDQYEQILNED